MLKKTQLYVHSNMYYVCVCSITHLISATLALVEACLRLLIPIKTHLRLLGCVYLSFCSLIEGSRSFVAMFCFV